MMTPGFASLVEQRIQEAMKEGKFNNLSGHGKPMKMDRDPYMPEELRLAYKVLKNAGCVPRELDTNIEIRTLEDMLDKNDDLTAKLKASKKLKLLKRKLDQHTNYTKIFNIPEPYENRVIDKIEHTKIHDFSAAPQKR